VRRPLRVRKLRHARPSAEPASPIHFLRFAAALSGGARCARYRGIRQGLKIDLLCGRVRLLRRNNSHRFEPGTAHEPWAKVQFADEPSDRHHP
jgi:hypothetical protein